MRHFLLIMSEGTAKSRFLSATISRTARCGSIREYLCAGQPAVQHILAENFIHPEHMEQIRIDPDVLSS